MDDLLRHLIREMAQAQTRKLGIPRVSKIDQIKKLVSDPPHYAIRFTDYERPANDVRMSWDEGHGTFMFPLTAEVYSALIRNKIGFSNGQYTHIFKIPKYLLTVGKNETDVGDEEVKSLINEIVSRKKFKVNALIHSNYFSEDPTMGKGYNNVEGASSALMKIYLKNKIEIGGNSSLFKLKEFFKLPAFSIALMNMGIDGFIDPGVGFIYKTETDYENSQIIVTNPKALHWIETMNTKDLMSFRDVLKFKKSAFSEYYDKLSDKYVGIEIKDIKPSIIAKKTGGEHSAKKAIIKASMNLIAFENLIKGLEKQDRKELIKTIINSDTISAEILERLSEDPDEEIRQEIANNSKTPKYILEKLSEDEIEDVRTVVAYNSNTPPHILKKLANDSSETVRSTIMDNTSVSIEILKILSMDSDPQISNSAKQMIKHVVNKKG